MTGILNIQIKPTTGNKEINLKKIEHYLKKYSNRKLDLVVFPEMFSTGVNNEYFTDIPEDANGGRTTEKICELANKYNTNIIAGTVIEEFQNKFYNTSFVINREGNIVEKYRKIHLNNYLGGDEGERITAGENLVVVDLDFGKIGLGIGFDIRYPQYFKKLTQMGAEIIVLPTAWLIPTEIYEDYNSREYAKDMWLAINRTRAYDNMVYIVTSNQTGIINENISGLGNSLIISPTAEILANAKEDQCAIYADIDIDAVKYLKNIYPIANID